jgi:predicted PurR-regulated permease PerM
VKCYFKSPVIQLYVRWDRVPDQMLIIVLTVMGLHVFAMNVLYPKVLSKRLQLDPLAVTISLLIWGALGLILAVPIMGAVKIVCDHVATLRPIGAWMGE